MLDAKSESASSGDGDKREFFFVKIDQFFLTFYYKRRESRYNKELTTYTP